MPIRHAAAAAGISAAIVLSVAACGGKVPSHQDAAPVTPAPTVAEVTGWLNRATDPSVPAAAKQAMIQGNLGDPHLASKIFSMYTSEGAKISIVDVHPTAIPTEVTVDANLQVWNKQYPQQVPFVLENGTWKMSKQYACNALKVMNLSSAACS